MVRFLRCHGRRERAITFPLFDGSVNPIPVLGRTRVGQNATVAESPRPELHPPLSPAEHRPLGQKSCGFGRRVSTSLKLEEVRPPCEERLLLLRCPQVCAPVR